MKMKNKNTVDCELRVKSTAALRQEIISELTKPDRPISNLLLGQYDDTDEHTDSDGDGQTDS
jgi:hypothetical protein